MFQIELYVQVYLSNNKKYISNKTIFSEIFYLYSNAIYNISKIKVMSNDILVPSYSVNKNVIKTSFDITLLLKM